MHIWYAAYGSNLLEDRFLTYLRGGPVPISGRQQHGARNAADPLDSRPYRIDRLLSFNGESKGWSGGGVAFVDPHTVIEGDTLGRAWLITEEQLADVWAQENGGTTGPDLNVAGLEADGHLDLGRGWYRRLEYLGRLEGVPVATITGDALPDQNAAGPAYLEVVGRGLMATWDLSAEEVAHYLAGRAGNAGAVTVEQVAALLSSPSAASTDADR
ncbi:MAG: histone deacetylase [Actinomycetota bacterium]